MGTPDEEWLLESHRRNQIIKRAVEAADSIIVKESKSKDEIDYVTAMVARQFVAKATFPFMTNFSKKGDP